MTENLRHESGRVVLVTICLLLTLTTTGIRAQDIPATATETPIPSRTVIPTEAQTAAPTAVVPTDIPTPVATSTELPTSTATLTATFTETPSEAGSPTLVPTSTDVLTEETTEEVLETTTVSPTSTDTEALTMTSTAMPESTATAIPALPPEPPMILLAHESLDNADLSPWQLGAGWTLTSSEGGLALQVQNSGETARYGKGPFFNAAVEVRFRPTSGSTRLSVRQSPVGSYTAVVDASGNLQLLRAGAQLVSAMVAPLPENTWHTLRFSVVDGVIRLAVDGTDAIAIEDDAPLPPGHVEISAAFPVDADTGIASGTLLVDDLTLWVPQADYGLYPTPSPIPTATPMTIPTTLTSTLTATPTVEPPTSTPTSLPSDTPAIEPILEVTEEVTAEMVAPLQEQTTLEPAATPTETPALTEQTNKSRDQVLAPSQAQLLVAQAASNDSFASALAIDAAYPDNVGIGDTTAATLEANETLPLGCGYNVGRTVWFNFTPASDGNFTISLEGSSFDTVLGVYTGTTVTNLTQIGCNDDASSKVLTSQIALKGLTAGTTYHLQISGYQQAFGLYNLTVQQTGMRNAARPALLQPASRATLADQTPPLSWRDAANATAYEIQISSDKNFATLVVDPAPIVFATTFTPTSALAPGLYYWRVRGLNANGVMGGFSGARTFTVDLNAPDLKSPVSNAIVNSVRPTFSFNTYGSGVTYEIELSDTNNFATDLDQSFMCTRTRCSSTDFSLHQGTWYWRLRVVDSMNNPTAYSASQVFTIQLLRSPADRAVVTTAATATITFQWFGVPGASGYTLQLDEVSGFPSPQSYSATATSFRVNGMTPGIYYWRVLADGLDLNPALVVPRLLTVSPTPLAAPRLLSPIKGATTADQTPTMDWDDSPGTGVTYNLQVCTRSSCRPDSTIVASVEGLTQSQYTLPAALDTGSNGASQRYYWRVQAVNELDVPGKWAASLLNIRTAPPDPASPRNETSTTDSTPALTWKGYPGATYDLEIATNNLFTSVVISETGLTQSRYTLAAELAEGTYFWHVRAVDGTPLAASTAFSTPYRFTVGPRPPAAPRLLSPTNGSMLADQRPAFDWADVSGSVYYCLVLADNARFDNPEIEDCSLTTSDYTPATPLDPRRYYWHVRSMNALGGLGSYSSRWSITINISGPDPRSPADGGLTTDSTPRLTWTSYPRSRLYNIRVDTDPACDSSIGDFTSSSSSFTTPPLSQGTYFWCVQAQDYLANADSLTDFGAVRSFTVSIPSSPGDQAITQDTTPGFRWASAASGAQYCLDIDDDPGFESNDPMIYSVCDLSSTRHTVTSDLLAGIYVWRVRVSTDGGSTYTPAAPPYRTLTISPAAPSTPALSLPANRSTIWTTTPALTWKPSAKGDPVEYTVEVDDNARFTSPDFTDTLPATSCTPTACSLTLSPALSVGNTYYWRVRATNAYEVDSRVSGAFRFTIANPVAPVLMSPADASNATANPPTFRWKPLAGAVRFDIRLDTTNPPVNTPGLDLARTSFRPTAPLLTTTYYWQVQAYDSIGTPSGWSNIWSVKIETSSNGSPIPNRFGPGSTNAPHTVQLNWGPISWTDPGGWYEVVIDDNTNFSSPIYQSPQDDSVLPTGTQSIEEGTGGFMALANGLYYWQVRACDGTGRCGKWSDRGTFVVER